MALTKVFLCLTHLGGLKCIFVQIFGLNTTANSEKTAFLITLHVNTLGEYIYALHCKSTKSPHLCVCVIVVRLLILSK